MAQLFIRYIDAGDKSSMSEQPVKLTMAMLFTLLFSVGVGNIHCSTLGDNSTDMIWLLDFRKAITNDPDGILNSWDISTPFCEWKGVSCSRKHPGRVTALDLRDQGLFGQISPSLGNLTFLKALNLSANRLSGVLPPFSRLGKLQFLSLTDNSLEGDIPDGLTNCSKLMVLALSCNMLVGEIPRKLSLLSNLKMLGLNLNNLSGVIPPMLNKTGLEFLALSDNQLGGGIPAELGHLQNLKYLQLGVNMLSGPIPPSLFNLSSLRILDLDSNNLGGALPSNAGQALLTLKMLLLGKNMIEGKIPFSLGNASSLTRIDLSSNKFIGPIPYSLGRLSNLSHLNLQNNKLEAEDVHSWEFLDELSNCRCLNILSLYNNQLQGVIPSTVGNLSASLQQLVLGRNNLSGTVPPSIANLSGLAALRLGSNSFTGTIEWIGNLKKLQILSFQANNFIGRIPSTIGSLTLLSVISLAENKFDGVIPQSLSNLRRLSYLDLSGNNLQGNMPTEFSNLTQLTQLSLSRNKFTGEIPYDLGQCQELTIIEMEQNFLTGNIPLSLSNLVSLSTFNLSHNNLSGIIPVGLGNLRFLSQLDLSFNHLQGQVPTNGVFKNATAASLSGNWGLCGGIHELHLPSCDPVSQRANKRYLVRVLVPIFGVMSLLTTIYFILVNRNSPVKLFFSSTSFGDEFLKISYMDLAMATRNFSESNMIGRGSYGTVYKAKLIKVELDVAVKIFDLDMQGAEESFRLECEALKRTRHRNLLPIITTCSTVDTRGNHFKALIYEFMPRGNLDTWLHHRGGENKTIIARDFGLAKRLSIVVNVADALDYLHNGIERSVIHCDLKPTNILLDNDMVARLGDFGIASVFDNSKPIPIGESCSYNSIIPKGTIGYIAPEYAGGGHPSTYGDIYSFGIVLLEMLTGKRPTDPIFKDDLNIVNFVEKRFPDHIWQVVDAHIQEECKNLTQAMTGIENATLQCLMSLLQVALSCTRQVPVERMKMKDIATKMHAIQATYEEGKERIVQYNNSRQAM